MPHEPAPGTLLPLTTALHEALRHTGRPVLEVLLQHLPDLSGAALLNLTGGETLVCERQAGTIPAFEPAAVLAAILAVGEVAVDADGARCIVPLSATRALAAYAAPGKIDSALAATLHIAGQMIGLSLGSAQSSGALDLRDIFGRLEDVVLVLDRDGRYLQVASASPDQLLRPADELIGRSFAEALPAEIADQLLGYIRRALEENQPVRAEYALPIQGKETWFSARIAPIDDRRVVWVAHEITARQQRSRELMEARRMLQLVLDSLPLRVFWKDANLVYGGCNAAFAGDVGLSDPADLAGKTDRDLPWQATQAEEETYQATERAVIEGGAPRYHVTQTHQLPDGHTLWLDSSWIPLTDDLGQTVGVLGMYEDVTERREAEQRVRQLSLAVEQSPSIVIITDMRGKIEYVNSRFTAISGYSAEEAIGQDVGFLRYTHDRPETELWEGLATGREWRGEFRNRKKSGEEFWVSASITPIRDDHGQVIQYLAVQQDITEQRRTAEALRQQQEFLSQLIEYTPSPMLVKDWDGKFILANRAFAEIYGTTPDAIVGKTDFDFNSDREQVEQFLADDRQVMRSGEAKYIPAEQLNDAVTGEPRWMQTVKAPLPAPDGSNYVLAVATDITKQMRATEALDEQRSFLRQIIDANPSIILVKDWDGRFVMVNKALADLYGATIDQLIGKTDADFNANPEQVAQYLADDREVMQSGKIKHIPEEALTSTSGETRWLQTIKVPLAGPDGSFTQVLAVATDITERKRLEMQIQESLAQRGEQVNTVTQVAQEIAAAANLDVVFERVVSLIKERFGYYHTQIFRYDPANQVMRLQVGYGETGRQMLEAGHSLPLGRGVVGMATSTGQSVLAADTTADADWVPNPFLPDTRGELAVPIKFRGEIVGILDVQSDTPGRLTAEDQFLLEGLCGQIAIVIESTRLLDEANTFRQLILASGQGIGMTTLDGQVYYANPRLLEIVQEPDVAAMQRHDFHDYYPLHLHHRLDTEILPVLRAGGEWTGEMALLARDGTITPTLENFFTVKDEAGQARYIASLMTDISGIKAAEAAIAAERNRLQSVMDTIPLPVFFKDVAGVYAGCNRAFEDYLGRARSDIVGKTVHQIAPSDLAEVYHQADLELIAQGKPQTYESKVTWADGSRRDVIFNKAVFYNADNTPAGLVGAIQDITERKQFEERMAAERNLLRTLIDSLPDYIYVKDFEGRFLITNQANAEYMGAADPEEAVGKTDYDYYSKELADVFMAADMGVIQTGEPFVAEENVTNEVGQTIWITTIKLPMRDSQGNVIGLVGVGRDITERKFFEDRMAAERGLLRILIDNIPDSVFVKDRQSRNLLNNVAHYRDILGVSSQEEAQGKTDFDFFPKEMAQQYYEDEQALMATGEALIEHEHQVLKPDGSLIAHLNTKVPLRDATGAVIGLVGIARDITDRRRAEIERDRLFAAEREQRQYSEVLAEISLALTSKTDLDDVLGSVLDYAIRLVPAIETASLSLISGADTMRVVRWLDRIGAISDPSYAREPIPLAAVAGVAPALNNQQPVVIADAHADPLWASLRQMTWARSLLLVPLVQRGQVLGLLWLTNSAPDSFNAAMAERLMPLANAAAIALENNRLLQDAQQHAEREERLNQIGVQIQQHTEMADLLTVTLQELGQTLGAKVGRIRLAVSEGQPQAGGGSNGQNATTAREGRA